MGMQMEKEVALLDARFKSVFSIQVVNPVIYLSF